MCLGVSHGDRVKRVHRYEAATAARWSHVSQLRTFSPVQSLRAFSRRRLRPGCALAGRLSSAAWAQPSALALRCRGYCTHPRGYVSPVRGGTDRRTETGHRRACREGRRRRYEKEKIKIKINEGRMTEKPAGNASNGLAGSSIDTRGTG